MGLLDLLITVLGGDGLCVLDGLQGFLGVFLSVHNAVHILSIRHSNHRKSGSRPAKD